MISQVYNISGDLNDFVLTWVLGFPIMYLLIANTAAYECIIVISSYGTSTGYFTNDSVSITYFVEIVKEVNKNQSGNP